MAMAAKAKAPASDTIMSSGEMKPLLALSKREPLHAAIGITSDGEGVILLKKHKLMKPKKVLTTLRAEAKKAGMTLNTSSLRFGKAEVDTDYDPGMVRFFINKEAPGNMRIKLVEVVKRIPYAKVELNVEPSLEDEPEEEEDGQETTAADAPMAAGTAPPPPVAPTPPQGTAKPQLDLTALTNTLGQLTLAIPKVADGDAALQESLVRFATMAQGSLKAGDLAKAEEGIEALRRALGAAMEQAKLNASLAGGAGPVAYGKSRLIWLAVRKKLETDVDSLRQKLLDHYKDAAIAGDLDTRFKERVGPVLEKLDDELADLLDGAINATDAAKRGTLVEGARKKIKQYQDTVASEKIFDELDANPFVPLAVKQTMTATLATLAKAVH